MLGIHKQVHVWFYFIHGYQHTFEYMVFNRIALDLLLSRPVHFNSVFRYYFNDTVYPKKYAHGSCFAVLCCGYTLTEFTISIRLTSLALWQSNDCPSASKPTLMNMDKYFMWIHYERLHNHNKAKHNKTVCIFLGIYCIIKVIAKYTIVYTPPRKKLLHLTVKSVKLNSNSCWFTNSRYYLNNNFVRQISLA